jgi:hypothetical protein
MNRSFCFQRVLYCVMMTVVMMGTHAIYAQVPRKYTNERHKHYHDSLMNMNYNYVFPLLGDKVYKRGFDIPFPFGIMINSFYGWQGIDISNINIGIKGPNKTLGPANLDNIIEFSDVKATALNVNLRADMYVLPFLNVYALLSYLPYAKTHVQLSKPINLTAEPKQHGWVYGAGAMCAFGFGPVWMSVDYNVTWANMELLENKVFTQVAGIRIGHVFSGKTNAESNVSVWMGMMGMFLNNNTVGSIAMSEIFPDMTQQQVDETRQNYNNEGTITPIQKEILDEITQKIRDRINRLPVNDTYITYQMNKAPKSKWAGLVGAQYQFNKRWQLRSECNFISSERFSIMASVNYRFLGFKKQQVASGK